jgi:exosortase H (IPTLxxWG-CTERM-specific)
VSAVAEEAPAPKRRRGLDPGRRFILTFMVLAAVFYSLAWTDAYSQGLLPLVTGVQADISGWVLNILGKGVETPGNEVRGAGFSLRIVQGCDASEATALYVAACFAFPVAWADRFKGAALGIAMIFVLNVARVVTLYLIGEHASDWFHVAHVDIWPVLILLDAVLIWALWARFSRRARRAAA